MDFGFMFTNVLTAFGVATGWMNPIFGLFVYYAFALIRPTSLWFWSWGATEAAPGYSKYVALSTLIGWSTGGFGKWPGLESIKWPLYGMALYLGWGVLATEGWAVSKTRAWHALDPQLKIGLMILVCVSIVRDTRQIKAFMWVTWACLAYLAWVFNSQYYFDGWNRIWYRGFGSVDNNGTAMMMVVAVPLAFFLGIHERRWWLKGLCFFSVALFTHVILFSFSRGGQLGLCVAGSAIFYVALVKLPNKMLTIACAVVFTVMTISLAGDQVRERFWSIFMDKAERDESAASRFDTWAGAWACMKANPLGVGPRNFNLVSNQYGLVRGKSVHNLFLQTGADYGIPGMFGLALFYFGSMWKTWKMSQTKTAKRLKWPQYYGHSVVISLGSFLVCSTFIGMESVEAPFIIAQIGLCTVAYVDRIAVAQPEGLAEVLPELQEVPASSSGEWSAT